MMQWKRWSKACVLVVLTIGSGCTKAQPEGPPTQGPPNKPGAGGDPDDPNDPNDPNNSDDPDDPLDVNDRQQADCPSDVLTPPEEANCVCSYTSCDARELSCECSNECYAGADCGINCMGTGDTFECS